MIEADRPLKRMACSEAEQVHLLTAGNMNGANRLLGGQLMTWIDETGAVAAMRHANRRVTTALVENMAFLKPLFAHDKIVITARVEYVGHTSMEVRVRTWHEALDGTRTLANIADIVMVALDDEGRPCAVPGLLAETEEEKAALAEGRRRAERRKENGYG